MALAINRDIIAWALAVIQPASISELRGFLVYALKDESVVPDSNVIADEVRELVELNDVHKVAIKPARYSLTRKGEQRLHKKIRHLRDRMRLFLMKNASYSRFYVSSEVLVQDMDDASSSSSTGTTNQDAQRPNTFLVADQKAIWPLVSEQFQIGSVSTSGESKPLSLQFYSFGTEHFPQGIKSTRDLAEVIGISTRLITSIAKNKSKHYRSFDMPKKSGGKRRIDSPRTFLKVIQRWVADHLLFSLQQHHKCMSYRRGVSVRTNACLHQKKQYVMNLDIENFFGSIKTNSVSKLLLERGFSPELSEILSELCTFQGSLPQGAPSSPVLSNSLLYEFDCKIDEYCSTQEVTYSRYADDITLSAENSESLKLVQRFIEKELNAYSLQLKPSKTRLTHISQKQVVTGLVVNERAKPSREYRRHVRAIFHRAQLHPSEFSDKKHMLNGFVAHLSSYGCISEDVKTRYKAIAASV